MGRGAERRVPRSGNGDGHILFGTPNAARFGFAEHALRRAPSVSALRADPPSPTGKESAARDDPQEMRDSAPNGGEGNPLPPPRVSCPG